MATGFAVSGLGTELSSLSGSESASSYGGCTATQVPNYCIQVNTTCTDSNVPATCTKNATTGMCNKCKMTVPNWSSCASQNGATYLCGQCLDGNSPYCGAVFFGTPEQDGSCPDKDCISQGSACGQQIPTVSGVPCPGGGGQ
jgi:hypothetical protein